MDNKQCLCPLVSFRSMGTSLGCPQVKSPFRKMSKIIEISAGNSMAIIRLSGNIISLIKPLWKTRIEFEYSDKYLTDRDCGK